MKCIIVAMEKEAKPLLSRMKIKKERIICGKKLYFATLCGEKTALIICGVGKVNAACGAQILIDLFKPKAVINFGVAGGLNKSVEIAKTYAIEKVVQYDFDLAQINGTEIGTLDECKENYLPLCAADGFERRVAATGDRFNDDKADFKLLTKVLNADLRDMELGAIAQVCMHAKVKCCAFKTVSDLAGSGSTTDEYLKNLGKCFEEMKKIIEPAFKGVKI